MGVTLFPIQRVERIYLGAMGFLPRKGKEGCDIRCWAYIGRIISWGWQKPSAEVTFLGNVATAECGLVWFGL